MLIIIILIVKFLNLDKIHISMINNFNNMKIKINNNRMKIKIKNIQFQDHKLQIPSLSII